MSRAVFRHLLLTAGLLAAGLTPARASGWHQPVVTDVDSGVAIDVDSPFEFAPDSGYLPLWVTVRNDSGAPRVWTVVCDDAGTPYRRTDRHASTATLRVENGQTVRAPILLVLDTEFSGAYYHVNRVRIDGYGLNAAEVSVPNGNAAYTGTATNVVVGMSEALATPIWTSLTKDYDDRKISLRGTPVDLGLLGGDWRALVSLDALWITDADFAALDAPRRTAVHDWVSQGGRLLVCAQHPDPALRAGVGLPAAGDEADAGLGHVRLLPWDGKPLPLSTVSGTIDALTSYRGNPATEATGAWPVTHAVGGIPLNAAFLIGFIVLFALLVGPLNLFVFARAARRHRLFWTTPAISVAASVLLAGVIVLQDGFGGHGSRVLFCLLLPDETKAVVWQEQAARTGILLSRQFQSTEDLVLMPLGVGSGGGAKRSFEESGRSYRGDWFTSRSVQAQRAEAVVPTRAGVQLVNAEAARGGAPPVFTSSVSATLKEIWYCDPAGGRWRGQNLRTGERITLIRHQASVAPSATPGPAPAGPLGSFEPPSTGGSDLFDAFKTRCASLPGYFVAFADEGPFFDTLPSIRWTGQHAVFAGPVAAAP